MKSFVLLSFALFCSCTTKPPLVPPGEGALALTLTFSNPTHAQAAATIIGDRLREAGVAKYSANDEGPRVNVSATGFNPGATTFLTAIATTRGLVTFHRVIRDDDGLKDAWLKLEHDGVAGVVPRDSVLVAESKELLDRAISTLSFPGRRLVVKPPGPRETEYKALMIDETAAMDGSAIRGIEQDDRGMLVVVFNDAGAQRFAEVTGKLIDQQLAIVADDQVWSAPFIQERVTGGRAVLSQSSPFASAEARLWNLLLRMRPFPSAPLKVE